MTKPVGRPAGGHFVVKAMAMLKLNRLLTFTIIYIFVGHVECSSTTSTASHQSVDSRVLKEEWKRIESSLTIHNADTGATVKKTLNIYRSLLNSLDNYRDISSSSSNSEKKRNENIEVDGVINSKEEEEGIKLNQSEVDDYITWDPKWTRAKIFKHEDVTEWNRAWMGADNAASFSQFNRPKPVIIPIRVDLIMVTRTQKSLHKKKQNKKQNF